MAELTGKETKFLTALLSSSTTAEAIAKAKIAENTAYRYLRDDRFKGELRKARRDIIFKTTSSLTASTERALSVLNDVMVDQDAPASSRVAAAKLVLDVAFNAVQADDIQERIERLEKLQGH